MTELLYDVWNPVGGFVIQVVGPICIDCGGVIDRETRNPVKTCASCQRKRVLASKAKYQSSDNGRGAASRFWASDKGQQYRKHYRIVVSAEVQERINASKKKYQESKVGAVRRAVAQLKRGRGLYGFSANYIELVRQVKIGNVECYSCGGEAEQVDHVLPVGLAKLFDLISVVDDYVAPICKVCHRVKSGKDLSDILRSRRLIGGM